MPKTRPEVTEFRSIVDQSILQANGNTRGIWWPGKESSAKAGGLHFASVGQYASRLMTFGFHEGHLWGIAQENQRIEKFSGDIAIVSLEKDDQGLYRRWGIASPLGSISISSERKLHEEEIGLALDWARSPHINGNALGELGLLDNEELASIERRYGEDREDAEKLRKDLEEMDRARRQAFHDMHDIRLY